MVTQRADRPVLVAVPGTLCAPSVFRRLGDRLAREVELDAVSWLDEPGPWDLESVADRLAELIERRHGGPVLVAGHSTGGAIAGCLAARRPDLVAGLLLIDTGPHMRGHGDVDRIIARVADAWGPDLHAAVLDRSFATPPDPADRAELLAYAAGVPQRAALQALRSQRDLDLTSHLAGLSCPVTVVHGMLDPTRTADQAADFAAAIPGARLRLLDTGHTPVHEDADAVAAEVRDLLARVAGVFLETDRLVLRRFTGSDVDNLVALDGDPAVMRYLTGGSPTPRSEIETETLPAFLDYYRRFTGYGFWAAIEKESGDFVGWFHFRPDPDDPVPDEPELGYRLRASAWGRGYATEGARALVDKGFRESGVRRVWARTMAVNESSRRVMENAGLRFVRAFTEDWPEQIEGSEFGDVEYALTRAEWESTLRPSG